MPTANEKPIVAVTMGDPAGVGPELCIRILSDNEIAANCVPVIVGSRSILERVAGLIGGTLGNAKIITPQALLAGPISGSAIADVPADGGKIQCGKCAELCGKLAYQYIDAALEAVTGGKASALVTGPINKKSLNMAGVNYPGHTELLAERTGSCTYCMMLTSEAITVSFVTTHVGYAGVPDRITPERVADVIRLTAEAVSKLNKRRARLAVCGLNPHAGEDGLFSSEEAERIAPGIAAARQQGIDVTGPFSPDAVFTPDILREFDAVVCHYHDQGHIPFKMLAFDTGVNVTLGLPIIRTSVDHGTAFDIAWKGVARVTSMKNAILLAVRLCGGTS